MGGGCTGIGGGSDAAKEVRGLPKFVPRGVVNEAGATKWYIEVLWTHKEGRRSREYICKLPVAIKESGVDQHNALVSWVKDAWCGFGVTMWTRKLPEGGTRQESKVAYLFKQSEVQDPSMWRWRRAQSFGRILAIGGPVPDRLGAEAQAYWKVKEEVDAHQQEGTARAKVAMVDVDAPPEDVPTHAPRPEPQAVPPPKPAKNAARPPSQPSEPSHPQAEARTEDARKRPRSPLDEEALAKRVAAEVVEQVRGVLEKGESAAEGHGGSGADPRGVRAERRFGVETHAQIAALEAVIKDLVAKDQPLQTDRTNMVKELEAAKGKGQVLQEQVTALQTRVGGVGGRLKLPLRHHPNPALQATPPSTHPPFRIFGVSMTPNPHPFHPPTNR